MSAWRELKTIQTKEKLNNVFRIGEPGPGGAYHDYAVTVGERGDVIRFQKGPRKDPEARHGVLDVDLLEIVRDRLTCFQAGEYACSYNQEALEHVEAALHALNQRVEDRIARGVLGKNEK